MDIIPGDVNSRFVFIHILHLLLGFGAWCTIRVLWREWNTLSRATAMALVFIGYAASGVVYLLMLQSQGYREFAGHHPVVAGVVEAPVWLFSMVDYVLAPHAGGTALHSLLRHE
jgi:hypothetical protein